MCEVGGLGQLRLIPWGQDLSSTLARGRVRSMLRSAKKLFRKDVLFMTVRIISSQLYLSGNLKLRDREDSWAGILLLVSKVWKKTHLREVMNDGYFLANKWPSVRSLCVIYLMVFSVWGRDRLWECAHTQTRTQRMWFFELSNLFLH